MIVFVKQGRQGERGERGATGPQGLQVSDTNSDVVVVLLKTVLKKWIFIIIS